MGCQIDTVRHIGPHWTLKRCRVHGIAFVQDGTTGQAHSAHANISASGYPAVVYGRDARIVRCHGWAYNTDRIVRCHGWAYNTDRVSVSDYLDEIARQECRCGGSHGERPSADLERGAVIKAMDAAIRLHQHAASEATDRQSSALAYFAENAVRDLRGELLGSRMTEVEEAPMQLSDR